MIIKKIRSIKINVVVLTFLYAGVANAAPVDLSSWLTDGPGNWTLQTEVVANDSVFQSLNSGPSMFFNNMNSQGMALSGSIEVQSASDDDFVGFVLGYNDDDLFAGTTDYILIDWKQGTQSGWDAGMSISRVTGAINAGGTDTTADAWTHTGNVSFIERAATLDSTGWMDNTAYLFDISFTATNITVMVDGIEQFNIDGTFNDGSFGFYNFSQPAVRYAGIEEEIVQPPQVPEPGSLILLGAGLIGLGFLRRKKV